MTNHLLSFLSLQKMKLNKFPKCHFLFTHFSQYIQEINDKQTRTARGSARLESYDAICSKNSRTTSRNLFGTGEHVELKHVQFKHVWRSFSQGSHTKDPCAQNSYTKDPCAQNSYTGFLRVIFSKREMTGQNMPPFLGHIFSRGYL